jgi:hypothetical protein
LSGIAEGLIALGMLALLFYWFHRPFSFVGVVIVGVEYASAYTHGIVIKEIGAEIPMCIGNMVVLFGLSFIIT